MMERRKRRKLLCNLRVVRRCSRSTKREMSSPNLHQEQKQVEYSVLTRVPSCGCVAAYGIRRKVYTFDGQRRTRRQWNVHQGRVQLQPTAPVKMQLLHGKVFVFCGAHPQATAACTCGRTSVHSWAHSQARSWPSRRPTSMCATMMAIVKTLQRASCWRCCCHPVKSPLLIYRLRH